MDRRRFFTSNRRGPTRFVGLARALLLGVLLLVACEHQVTDYPPQPAMTVGPYLERVTVTVKWHQNVDEIASMCRPPRGDEGIIYECSYADTTAGTCAIHALPPADFNDQTRLALLGHEMLHCLGAQHGS